MDRSYGIAASLALHAALVMVCLYSTRAPQTPVRAPPPVQVMALSKDGDLLDVTAFQGSVPTCLRGKAYMGIGIQYNLDDIVIEAPQSYPAYKAGIRPGDAVLNPYFQPDADGYDIVDVARHGRRQRLRIKTQWICLR